MDTRIITRVTKLGNVSVFYDLNDFDNISMNYAYNSTCGITEEELKEYFPTDIEEYHTRAKGASTFS